MSAGPPQSSVGDLLPRYGQRAFIAKSLPYYLEMAAPGVSKATGSAHVCELLGIAPEECIAFGDGENDIELIEWDLAQLRYVDLSTRFAGILRDHFQGRVPLDEHQLAPSGPYRVLESANMPAILIELGYLTNPEQAKLLGGDAFQNAVVQALFDAIVRYRDTLPGGGTH